MPYYAVRVGKTPGIYETWDECQANVAGVAGAQYKKFKTRIEAENFINSSGNDYYQKKEKQVSLFEIGMDKSESSDLRSLMDLDNLPEVYSFVDGSFNSVTGVYGYGGFVSVNGVKHILQGSGNDPEMAAMRNVSGEILGAMAAIQFALDNSLPEITILYDYKGIELWALEPGQISQGLQEKAWKANKPGTIAYRDFVRKARGNLLINYGKVAAHTGIDGNEEADRLAKEAVGID